MSRIGKQPINLPKGVTVSLQPGAVSVKGPKGQLLQTIPNEMTVSVDDGVLSVTVPKEAEEQPHKVKIK